MFTQIPARTFANTSDAVMSKIRWITTQREAVQAVEAAPWDEYGSALSGSEIWGVRGSFATPRATSHYSYESALAEARAVKS